MINYKRFELDNGLRVLVHEDKSTPLVAMNILYDVGSRDEDPDSTGLAHLFEHLMFGGSVNIAEYDTPLQMVGGENNAFTNNDITNYYLTIPSQILKPVFGWNQTECLNLIFHNQA
jgi:zinc protease